MSGFKTMEAVRQLKDACTMLETKMITCRGMPHREELDVLFEILLEHAIKEYVGYQEPGFDEIAEFRKYRSDRDLESLTDILVRTILMPEDEYRDILKQYTSPDGKHADTKAVAGHFGVPVSDAFVRGCELGLLSK